MNKPKKKRTAYDNDYDNNSWLGKKEISFSTKLIVVIGGITSIGGLFPMVVDKTANLFDLTVDKIFFICFSFGYFALPLVVFLLWVWVSDRVAFPEKNDASGKGWNLKEFLNRFMNFPITYRYQWILLLHILCIAAYLIISTCSYDSEHNASVLWPALLLIISPLIALATFVVRDYPGKKLSKSKLWYLLIFCLLLLGGYLLADAITHNHKSKGSDNYEDLIKVDEISKKLQELEKQISNLVDRFYIKSALQAEVTLNPLYQLPDSIDFSSFCIDSHLKVLAEIMLLDKIKHGDTISISNKHQINEEIENNTMIVCNHAKHFLSKGMNPHVLFFDTIFFFSVDKNKKEKVVLNSRFISDHSKFKKDTTILGNDSRLKNDTGIIIKARSLLKDSSLRKKDTILLKRDTILLRKNYTLKKDTPLLEKHFYFITDTSKWKEDTILLKIGSMLLKDTYILREDSNLIFNNSKSITDSIKLIIDTYIMKKDTYFLKNEEVGLLDLMNIIGGLINGMMDRNEHRVFPSCLPYGILPDSIQHTKSQDQISAFMNLRNSKMLKDWVDNFYLPYCQRKAQSDIEEIAEETAWIWQDMQIRGIAISITTLLLLILFYIELVDLKSYKIYILEQDKPDSTGEEEKAQAARKKSEKISELNKKAEYLLFPLTMTITIIGMLLIPVTAEITVSGVTPTRSFWMMNVPSLHLPNAVNDVISPSKEEPVRQDISSQTEVMNKLTNSLDALNNRLDSLGVFVKVSIAGDTLNDVKNDLILQIERNHDTILINRDSINKLQQELDNLKLKKF